MKINLDPNALIKKMKTAKSKSVTVTQNSNNETVLLELSPSCARVHVYQKNGYERINVYYPNGTQEEIYEVI